MGNSGGDGVWEERWEEQRKEREWRLHDKEKRNNEEKKGNGRSGLEKINIGEKRKKRK